MREEGARIHGQCPANCASYITEYSQTYCSYTKEFLLKTLLFGLLVLVDTRCQKAGGMQQNKCYSFLYYACCNNVFHTHHYERISLPIHFPSCSSLKSSFVNFRVHVTNLLETEEEREVCVLFLSHKLSEATSLLCLPLQ